MKTVLIVDDDQNTLLTSETLLKNENTIIYTTPNVKGALTILDFTKIDVALLDYNLPKITGDKLAKHININHPSIKVFMMSGYDEAVDAVMEQKLAVSGVLRKPVDPELMVRIAETDDYHNNVLDTANQTDHKPSMLGS